VAGHPSGSSSTCFNSLERAGGWDQERRQCSPARWPRPTVSSWT